MFPVFEKELRRTSVISTLYLVLKCLLSPPCDVDAMTRRSCSCSDAELVQMLTRWMTDICEIRVGRWEQEGCYTQNARRVGWGIPVTVLAPVTELMTRHWHFSKGKLIKS